MTRIFNDFLEGSIKVSNCCCAECIETDYGICPDCKEHCEFVDLIEEEGEENE